MGASLLLNRACASHVSLTKSELRRCETRLVRAGCGRLHKTRFTLSDGQPDDWFTFQFRRRT